MMMMIAERRRQHTMRRHCIGDRHRTPPQPQCRRIPSVYGIGAPGGWRAFTTAHADECHLWHLSNNPANCARRCCHNAPIVSSITRASTDAGGSGHAPASATDRLDQAPCVTTSAPGRRSRHRSLQSAISYELRQCTQRWGRKFMKPETSSCFCGLGWSRRNLTIFTTY